MLWVLKFNRTYCTLEQSLELEQSMTRQHNLLFILSVIVRVLQDHTVHVLYIQDFQNRARAAAYGICSQKD